MRALEEILPLAERERSSTDPGERRRLIDQVAKGLGHDEWYVRERCIELLSKAQDAAAAHQHLIAGAARVRQDFENRRRELRRRAPPKIPRDAGPFKNQEDLERFLKQGQGVLESVAEVVRLIDDWQLLHEAYRRALVAIPAEPRRRGLLALQKGLQGYEPKLMEALLDVADESVIAAIGDVHAVTEADVRDTTGQLAAARSLKPRPMPKDMRDKDAWTTQERTRIQSEIQAKADSLRVVKSELAEFGEQVLRFAAAQSLPPAPPGSAANADWRAWCGSAKRAFAERSAK